MKTAKSVLGYIWAALCALAVFVTLMGATSGLDDLFVSVTGLTISPLFSGGEVVRTIKHGTYQTQIHRPVFDALIGERKKGFVQVGWAPPEDLPRYIDQEIDVDADGAPDFRIQLDTETLQADLTPYAPYVIGLEDVYQLREELAIRVLLWNPSRR